MYVFILQQDNTQNIKPEGQQGSKALTAARNKKCLEQILATTIRIRTEAYWSTYKYALAIMAPEDREQ